MRREQKLPSISFFNLIVGVKLLLFDFALNTSSISQGFYDKFGNMFYVPAKWAINKQPISGNWNVLKPIKSFIHEMQSQNIKQFWMERSYAFGDILILISVAQYLKEQFGMDAGICTAQRYTSVIHHMGIRTRRMEGNKEPFEDYGIKLDSILELDHSVPALQHVPRSFIYLKALGINKFPKAMPWNYNEAAFPAFIELVQKDFQFARKNYIVFQGEGTTQKKQLPRDTIEAICKEFLEMGINVIYVGNHVDICINDERLEKAFTKYTVRQLFTIIRNAKALVCMDSSPLWISHFTKTPVLSILGPTRFRERLSLHPLYPEQASAVQANDIINCKSCYEQARACQQRVLCLKSPAEKIFSLIRPIIKKLWEK